MSDHQKSRWSSTRTRTLAGALVALTAVAGVVAATATPWPTLTRQPAQVTTTPAPAASVISCVGGLVTQGRDLARPGQLATVASQTVTAGVPIGVPDPNPQVLVAEELGAGEGALAFTAPPFNDARTDVAASGAATVAAEDIAGFTASACRPPLLESWLVGGSAATGAADYVILSNPGTVASTVQLTVYGATGAQNPAGGSDLVVAGGSQRIVPLAGLALGEASPVIHVSAEGAPIQAALQSSLTRTLLTGGVDQFGAERATELIQTIPGVQVTAAPGEEGASNATTVLRMLSPEADASATVTVRTVGSREPALPPTSVPLTAGIPTEVDLGGLPVGLYVVEVDASAPVAASVWQTTGFGEGDDFAWYTAAPLIEVPSLFAVPSGPTPQLTLVNPGDIAATVSITPTGAAAAITVEVPSGASAAVQVRAGEIYTIDAGGSPVRAALAFSDAFGIAGFPLWPADAAASDVTIYP
ncbi:DUF5719 family protein [Microbacterium lacus]|uniref:DUF5719 family protein n=1 Tax=Microbacterium lacus TaxID=415217 RepID=UPI00384CD799